MKCKIWLSIVSTFLVIGCSQTGSNQPAKENKSDTTYDIVSTKPVNADTAIASMKNIVRPGIDTFTTQLHLGGINDKKIVPISIVAGKELIAVIVRRDKKENIRINQLEMPDSTFDGPFGDSLHHVMRDTGTYKIIVAHDLMAEGKPSGDFTLKVWVK